MLNRQEERRRIDSARPRNYLSGTVSSVQPTILILAGQRPGQADPFARQLNLSHKCLVPVCGTASIDRVLAAATSAFPRSEILVSIEDFSVVAGQPAVERLRAEGRLRHVPAETNLVESVIRASKEARFPLLVTTGDNALVTRDAMRSVAERGTARGNGAVLAIARKQAIERAHPGGKKRYYEFRDGAYSNCNLFWLHDRSALGAAVAFRQGGQFLKVKGRMLKAFGPLILILMRLKLASVRQICRLASRRLGTSIEPLVLDDGRLAIDVDDMRSLMMAEEILGCAETEASVNG